MISTEVTHVSSLNGPGIANCSHSLMPRAGTSKGGRSTATSGLSCHPPSGHWTGGGVSFSSPAALPPSTHAVIVSISACFKDRSLLKCPYFGSANQGGIFLSATAALIAFAHGLISL